MKDIIELAREAGMDWQGGFTRVVEYVTQSELERFSALVRAAALEEAAMLCDVMEDGHFPDGHLCAGVAWECAAAIRALKEKP